MGRGVCLEQMCAFFLARACKSTAAAEEVEAAEGRVAGGPCPSARDSCIDVAGRGRASRGERARGPSGVGGSVGPWNLGF